MHRLVTPETFSAWPLRKQRAPCRPEPKVLLILDQVTHYLARPGPACGLGQSQPVLIFVSVEVAVVVVALTRGNTLP